MRLILKWVLREVRNDLKWSLFIVLSLALGLSGFLTTDLFRRSLDQQLGLNAKEFLSADFAVSSRRGITKEEREQLGKVISANQTSELVEFFSMIATPEHSGLVQVRVIDESYPLYGSLLMEQGSAVNRDNPDPELHSKPQIYIYQELKELWNLEVGEKLRLGDLEFEVSKVITQDSTQTFRMAGLAPRVYISKNFLTETKLLQFASTRTEAILYALPQASRADLVELKNRLELAFPDPRLDFETPWSESQDSSRAIQYLFDYLGLASMTSLLLSLLALAHLLKHFIVRRLLRMTLMQVLGASFLQSSLLVLVQGLGLALGGFILASALSLVVLYPLLQKLIGAFAPVPLDLVFSWQPFLVSFVVLHGAVVLTLLPYWVPLRKLPLSRVLGERDQSLAPRAAPIQQILLWLPLFFFILGMTIFVAKSVKIAALFLSAIFVSIVGVVVLAWGLAKILPDRHYILRRFKRRFFDFANALVALSLGSLLLVFVPTLQRSLGEDLKRPDGGTLPSLFLFDIQDEQREELNNKVREFSVSGIVELPMVRARIIRVNDTDFEREIESDQNLQFETRESETARRFRNRGVNLTFKSELDDSEEIIAGEPFKKVPGADANIAQLSVEFRYAERLGLKLGDLMTFDIQGVEMRGVVHSLRQVKWNTFRPNFFIVVQNGFLEEAPKMWLMSLQTNDPRTVQREIVRSFTNVSIVDIRRVVERVLTLGDQMALVLTGMAVMALIVGFIVITLILSRDLSERWAEWSLLNTLGLTREQTRRWIILESVFLAVIGMALGSLLAIAMTFVIMQVVFQMNLVVPWLWFAILWVTVLVLVTVVAWLLTRRFEFLKLSRLLGDL